MTATPATPPTSPTPPAVPRTPTPIIGLVSLVLMTTGSIWPFIVAVLAPVLREELGFSATMLGVAYGVYYLSGSLWSTVAGRLVDRGGFRVAGTVLLVVSAAQHVILAGSRGWWQLAVSGAVGGLGLALVNPVTNALIGAQLRGRAARNVIGVKQTGVPLGAVFAGTIVPAAAAAFGWRWSVLSAVSISALGVLLVLMVRGTSGAAPIGAVRLDIRQRFGIERFVLGMGIIASGIGGYLVLFLVDVFALSVQRAGSLAATLALSGAAGRIVWASLGGGTRTLPILRTLGTVGGVGLIALATITVEPGIWVAGVVLGVTVHAWQGLGMVAVIEADSSGTIGASSARVMRDFYLGFVIGSPLAGFIIDRVGFRAAWAVLAAVAFLAVVSLRAPETLGRTPAADAGATAPAGAPDGH
jgi:CP family cyanate transporter-like MFS transporter